MQPSANAITGIIQKIKADKIPADRKILELQLLERQAKDLLLLQVEADLEIFYKKLNKQHRKLLKEITDFIETHDQTFQALFNTLQNDAKCFAKFEDRPDLVLWLNTIIHQIDQKCDELEIQFNHDMAKIGTTFGEIGEL